MARTPSDVLALDVGELTSTAFAWWLGELRGLLPASMHRILSRHRRRLIIDITEVETVLSAEFGNRSIELTRVPSGTFGAPGDRELSNVSLANHVTYSTPVVIRLAAAKVLKLCATIPLSSARNLRHVLSFEIERLTPCSASQVYFISRIVKRDSTAKKLVVEVLLAQRAEIDRTIAALGALGFERVSVVVAADTWAGDRNNLIVSTIISQSAKVRRHVGRAVLAAATALAIATATLWLWRVNEVRASLAIQLATARSEAQATQRLQKAIDELAASQKGLFGSGSTIPVIKVVAGVTGLLPDNAWIYALEFRDREIRIRGFAASATDLLEVFDGSPLFANARFRAPLTQGPRSGMDKFDISFVMKSDSAQ